MAKYLDNDGLLYFWQKIKNTFAAVSHSHAISDVTNLQSTLNGKADSTHTHAIADVTNLQTTLNGKAADTAFGGASASAAGSKGIVPAPAKGDQGKFLKGNGDWAQLTISDVSNLENALDSYSEIDHKHAASDITSGTLGVARGGTGVSTLGAGVVYHSASGTGALSIASAANLVSAIGNSAVNRATADASGNNISDTYAKKTDIAGMYKYKGSVASESNLPTTGQSTGDVYNIESASSYGAAGANVAWNGTAWDSLGEIFSIASITNSEIDTIVAS